MENAEESPRLSGRMGNAGSQGFGRQEGVVGIKSLDVMLGGTTTKYLSGKYRVDE